MQQRRRLDVVTLSAPCCFLMLIGANLTVSIYKHRQTAACDPQQHCPQCLAALLLHALSRQVFRRKGTEIEGVFFSCRRFLPYPILLLLVLVIKACPALHNYHLGRIDKTGQD